MTRKEYMKAYRQTEEYKRKNAERMRDKYTTVEGKEYERKKKRYLRSRFNECKRSAKDRSLEFDLSYEQFGELLKDYLCSYCGRDISDDGGYLVDRMDNRRGYVLGNVTPCCHECNKGKSDFFTAAEFTRQNAINGRWKDKPLPASLDAVLSGCICDEANDTYIISRRCKVHGVDDGLSKTDTGVDNG